jgi:hypothetical protein
VSGRKDSDHPAWPDEFYYLMGSDGVAHSF